MYETLRKSVMLLIEPRGLYIRQQPLQCRPEDRFYGVLARRDATSQRMGS